MHPGLRAQEAVGVLAPNLQDGALDPRLLSFTLVEELDLEATPLRPPRVHPHEHRCPVLRLGAPGTGADLDLRVPEVVFAAHQRLELERIDFGVERFDHAVELTL